jgi:hypothetical protein
MLIAYNCWIGSFYSAISFFFHREIFQEVFIILGGGYVEFKKKIKNNIPDENNNK